MERGDPYFKKRMTGRLSKLFYATWIPPRKISMQNFILNEIKKEKEGARILDVGNSVGPGRTFAEKINENHLTLDIDKNTNPDYTADASCFCDKLNLHDKFDVVFSIGLLEHVLEPQKVINQCYKSLKIGGKALHWVPFIYRVHAEYGDYWRFTHDGLKHLFRNYRNAEIIPSEGFFSILVRMFYEATAQLKDAGFIIRIMSYPLAWLIVKLDKFTPQKLYCRGYFIAAEK